MGDKKISEKGISNAAELLYKGAKMLAHHCPDCKVPLFEKDGRIFCPSCGREAVFEEDVFEEDTRARDEEVERVGRIEETANSNVYRKIEEAISKICDMIIDAKSAEDVKVLSESVEKLASVLERLNKQK